MKKIYFLCSALLMAGSAFSQPVLTQANSTPAVGENFIYSRINWDGDAGSSGTNQTWDFSNIVAIGTTTVDHIAPAGAPSSSSFPGANVTVNYAGGTQYEFHKVSSSAYERLGFYAGGTAIPYSNSEKILEFPFTYNNTFTDPFGGTFISSGASFTRAGTATVSADGYGTLILPNGTFNNVLRVKLIEDYGDTYQGNEVYHYYVEVYMFYQPGIHIPVLALTDYEQSGNNTRYGNFLANITAGTEELTADRISVYPNPVKDQLFINWNDANHTTGIDIYNISGKLVFSSQQSINSINTSEFEAGVYFIHLGEGNGIKKFIKG